MWTHNEQLFRFFKANIRMPYRIRKVPKKDLYWVIAQDGKHMSKEGLPLEKAKAQMRALYASERQQEMKGGQEANPFDPAFAEQEVAKSRAAIQTGLSQLAPEQVEANIGFIKNELAPTKFTTRAAPTNADYERYANAYKKRGQAVPMTFQEWLAFQTKREAARQKDYSGMAESKRAQLENLGAVVSEREQQAALAAEEEARDPSTICPYDADGNRQGRREVVKKSECERRYDRFLYKENPTLYNANKYFFNPVVSGLTMVGDVIATASDFLPGVGQLAAEAYKTFAPPGSIYHGSGHTHYVPVRGSGTHKENVVKRLKLDGSSSLKELSEKSGVPLSILQEVYNRGIGAFKTQGSSVRLKGSYVKNVDAPMSKKLSKEQWAMARVYSFLDGNPKHDNDLRANKEKIGGGKYKDALMAMATSYPAYRGFTIDDFMAWRRVRPDNKFINMLIHFYYKMDINWADPDTKEEILRDAEGALEDAYFQDRERGQEIDTKHTPLATKKHAKMASVVEAADAVAAAAPTAAAPAPTAATAATAAAPAPTPAPAAAAPQEPLSLPKRGKVKKEFVPLRGGAWWIDAFNKAKEAARAVYQRAKDVVKGVRDDYPPSVRRVLAEVGNMPVVAAVIRRDPIKSMLHTALNAITLGSWEKMRQRYAFDKIYHLGLEVVVRINPATNQIGRYIIEKNEVINVSPAKAYTKDTETWDVPMTTGSTTINKLLEGAQRIQGAMFFKYDAFTNNCQDFIAAVLTGSGLSSPELLAVVKQPLDDALASLPGYTRKVARAVTDVAALANVALEGRGGVPKKALAKELKERGVAHTDYLKLARKSARLAGYDPKALEFSSKSEKKLMLKTPDGKVVHFGATGLGDYLLYSLSEGQEHAAQKRHSYLARASNIRGNWKANKYSPNNLAIHILWNPKLKGV